MFKDFFPMFNVGCSFLIAKHKLNYLSILNRGRRGKGSLMEIIELYYNYYITDVSPFQKAENNNKFEIFRIRNPDFQN